MGDYLEKLNPTPYEPPARAAAPLTPEDWSVLVRTDFTDDAAWTSVIEAVPRDDDDSDPVVGIVDDPAHAGATPAQLMALVRRNAESDGLTAGVVLIADQTSLHPPCRSVLVVLEDRIGCAFRVSLDNVDMMVRNLGVGNEGLEDWMDDETRDLVYG